MIIGDGAVIGMGEIVTKNVPNYVIVEVNPAKVIRYRFEEDIIKKLTETKWWNLPNRDIEALSKDIKNPTVFIQKLIERGK